MDTMSKREEQILLAVSYLEEDAYLVQIRSFLSTILGKTLSIGAVHIPLRRLERSGYIEAAFGEATAVRGGRRKKIYRLTSKSYGVLLENKRVQDDLWARFRGPAVKGTVR
jgi:PadR family transcriptional regulator, regulatory protein PadR